MLCVCFVGAGVERWQTRLCYESEMRMDKGALGKYWLWFFKLQDVTLFFKRLCSYRLAPRPIVVATWNRAPNTPAVTWWARVSVITASRSGKHHTTSVTSNTPSTRVCVLQCGLNWCGLHTMHHPTLRHPLNECLHYELQIIYFVIFVPLNS